MYHHPYQCLFFLLLVENHISDQKYILFEILLLVRLFEKFFLDNSQLNMKLFGSQNGCEFLSEYFIGVAGTRKLIQFEQFCLVNLEWSQ